MHFTIRLVDERLCTLVMLEVRPDGTKELIAVGDGYRESTEQMRRGEDHCAPPHAIANAARR